MSSLIKFRKHKFTFGMVDFLVEVGDYRDSFSPYIVLVCQEHNKLVELRTNKFNSVRLEAADYLSLRWGTGTLKDSPVVVLLNLINDNVKKRTFKVGTLSDSYAISFEYLHHSQDDVTYVMSVNGSYYSKISVRLRGLFYVSHFIKLYGDIENPLYVELQSKLDSVILNNYSSRNDMKITLTELYNTTKTLKQMGLPVIESR